MPTLKKASAGNNFDTFNIMGNVLSDIANLIEEIRSALSLSYNGVYSAYVKTYTNIRTFQHLITAYYNTSEKDIEIINLKITLVGMYQKLNKLEYGSDLMGEIFQKQLSMLKQEEAIFPRSRKSMTFTDFVKSESQ